MSRAIDAATRTALQASHVTHFCLVEMDLVGGPVRLVDLAFDVTVDGNLYTAAQGIGTIEPVTETDREASGLAFTLSAVNPAALAGALTELKAAQGRRVTLKLAVWDGVALRVDPNVWEGVFDVPVIQDGEAPVVRVTAEHLLLGATRPRGTLSSNEDQQARAPGDKFFEYAAQLAEATIVWPGKEFFKK
jgi:hypothetical protein